MLKFYLYRLGQIFLVLFILSITIFVLLNLMPGDITTEYLIENPGALPSPDDIKEFIKEKGYDKPFYIQYINLMSNLLLGNFGYSERYHMAISKLLPYRILVTLKLSIPVFIISLILAIPIGIFSALYQYSKFDYLTQFIIFLGISFPTFWVGLSFIYIFSLNLQLLPASGIETIGQSGFLDSLRYYILPIMVLSFHSIGIWARYIRGNFLDIINMDYMRVALSKGLSEDKIVFKHGLKNVLIPLLTLVALSIPHIVSGALITEQVFGIPGMGQLLINSVLEKDRNMALIAFMFLAFITVLFNFLADILYYIIDPRIRRQYE